MNKNEVVEEVLLKIAQKQKEEAAIGPSSVAVTAYGETVNEFVAQVCRHAPYADNIDFFQEAMLDWIFLWGIKMDCWYDEDRNEEEREGTHRAIVDCRKIIRELNDKQPLTREEKEEAEFKEWVGYHIRLLEHAYAIDGNIHHMIETTPFWEALKIWNADKDSIELKVKIDENMWELSMREDECGAALMEGWKTLDSIYEKIWG